MRAEMEDQRLEPQLREALEQAIDGPISSNFNERVHARLSASRNSHIPIWVPRLATAMGAMALMLCALNWMDGRSQLGSSRTAMQTKRRTGPQEPAELAKLTVPGPVIGSLGNMLAGKRSE